MKIREDILGNVPEIGDSIVFNPVYYKGLVNGVCVGFMASSGLPMVKVDKRILGNENKDGSYTPKTGFVCVKKITSNE